jgi:hypothetical protein
MTDNSLCPVTLTLWHNSCLLPSINLRIMLTIRSGKKRSSVKSNKYYKCDRCGYVSVVKNSLCPICIKDGIKTKLV